MKPWREWHNGMVTKAISACSRFIRGEGNWKARSRILLVRRASRNEAKKASVPRKNSSGRKGGRGYVSVTWRLAIGYSGYPLETRPTLFSADENFEKAILPSPLSPNLERLRNKGEGNENERKKEEERGRFRNSGGWKRGWIRGRIVNNKKTNHNEKCFANFSRISIRFFLSKFSLKKCKAFCENIVFRWIPKNWSLKFHSVLLWKSKERKCIISLI